MTLPALPRALWLSLPLLLLTPWVAAAADDPDLHLFVQVGIEGNLHAEGNWTPIWVRAGNQGADFAGELIVVPEDNDQEWERHVRAVELPQHSVKDYWLYACLPAQGKVHVELRARGRRRGASVDLLPPAEEFVLGMLGGPTPWPERLATVDQRRVRVVPLAPVGLPDRWPGYSVLDWVVVNPAGSAAFARPEQAEAFAAWVRAGGRAVVVAARGAAPVRGTVFESLLPAVLGETRDVYSTQAVGTFAGVDAPSAGTYAVSSVVSVRGKVLIDEKGEPLAIRGHAGLGEVILLTFDPGAPPFRGWAGAAPFWHCLLTGRQEEEKATEVRQTSYGYGGDPVVNLLERYPVAEPVSFGWLSLLFLMYVLTLWPGDWLLLRRLRRPGWMWGTLVVWVVVFGYAVYWVSTRGRGQILSLRQVSVVDVDGREGWTAGRTYAALYTPAAGRFDFAGPDGESFVSHRARVAEWRGRHSGQQLERTSGFYDERSGVALRSVWMTPASMKHFDMRWRAAPGVGLDVRAKLARDTLEVDCAGSPGLTGMVLLTRDGAWPDLGDVAAGRKRSIALREPMKIGDWAAQRLRAAAQQPAYYSRYNDQAMEPDWGVYSAVVRDTVYAQSVLQVKDAAREEVGQGTYLCRDVFAWLEAGGRVLLAVTPRSPHELQVQGEHPEVLEACVVRIFFD